MVLPVGPPKAVMRCNCERRSRSRPTAPENDLEVDRVAFPPISFACMDADWSTGGPGQGRASCSSISLSGSAVQAHDAIVAISEANAARQDVEPLGRTRGEAGAEMMYQK